MTRASLRPGLRPWLLGHGGYRRTILLRLLLLSCSSVGRLLLLRLLGGPCGCPLWLLLLLLLREPGHGWWGTDRLLRVRWHLITIRGQGDTSICRGGEGILGANMGKNRSHKEESIAKWRSPTSVQFDRSPVEPAVVEAGNTVRHS